jgi:hypothetical protein
MKLLKYSLVGALFFASASMFAGIITVSNNPNSPGQYTNLQTAINDALPGDTILVSGSPTTYGNINIDKTLTLYGQGFNTAHTYSEPITQVGTVTFLRFDAVQSANGSSISGFYTGDINFEAYESFDDITIERNSVYRVTINYWGYNYTNIVIQNNIFRYTALALSFVSGYYTTYALDVIVRSNFFDGSIGANIANAVSYRDLSNVLIENNFFSNSGTGTVLDQLKNAVFENNIFFRKDAGINSSDGASADCNSCVFNNNVFFSTQYDGTYDPGFLYGNNIGSGNMVGVDPLLVNFPLTGAAWSPSYDYNLDVGSPAIDAGTDATDIGTTGGERPMPDPILPRIPQMTDLSASPSSVPVGGTLQIQFSGQKQD